MVLDGPEQLSAHALQVGFITETYAKGIRDEEIMRHTRHRDLRTMRGYVRRRGAAGNGARSAAFKMARSSPHLSGIHSGAPCHPA